MSCVPESPRHGTFCWMVEGTGEEKSPARAALHFVERATFDSPEHAIAAAEAALRDASLFSVDIQVKRYLVVVRGERYVTIDIDHSWHQSAADAEGGL